MIRLEKNLKLHLNGFQKYERYVVKIFFSQYFLLFNFTKNFRQNRLFYLYIIQRSQTNFNINSQNPLFKIAILSKDVH